MLGWVRPVVLSTAACVAACGGSGARGEQAADTGSTTMGTSSGTSGSSTGEPRTPFSGSVRVMTFNVLCSLCGTDFDPWDDRVPWMADTIVRQAPDLIGLQEVAFEDEVGQILDAIPGYAAVYWGIDGEPPYPDATVLYKEDLFEEVEHGFYWLSPTPDTPMSTGFADGLQLARLVTWAVIRRLDDGADLYFATTHFDNNSPSQELSAPLVLERTAPFVAELPTVVVGDFNSRPSSEAYAILTGGQPFLFENAFDLAPQWTMDTNQDPQPEYDISDRIDHVFVAGGAWSATNWVVDTWIYGPSDLYISDHFAITADIALP